MDLQVFKPLKDITLSLRHGLSAAYRGRRRARDIADESERKQKTPVLSGTDLANMLPGMLPRLWAFAFRLTGNQLDAEDLVQRACVRGLEHAHQLRPGASPLSWMFSIVDRTWINELRGRNVRKGPSTERDGYFVESVADLAGQTPEMRLINTRIIEAVMSLPETQRVVMLLVAVEGLNYMEVAQALDVSVGTVVSRQSRARQAIGAQFALGGKPADIPTSES